MEHVLAFAVFAFVASITPGPTNFLILSTSSQYGLKQSLSIVIGSSLGAAFLVCLIGLGVGEKIVQHPTLKLTLSLMGGLWLTWMAWKIFNDHPNLENQVVTSQKKYGFFTGFTLQLINPKSWLMVIAVITVYMSNADNYTQYLLFLALIFMLIALPCLFAWACLGKASKILFSSTKKLIIFHRILAIGLLISVWYPILKI